jgi:hypothetical protein
MCAVGSYLSIKMTYVSSLNSSYFSNEINLMQCKPKKSIMLITPVSNDTVPYYQIPSFNLSKEKCEKLDLKRDLKYLRNY